MKNIIYLALLLFFTVSCNKDEDKGNSAPAITVSKPFDGQEMQTGDSFEVVIDLSDDVSLRQCIIEIHHNFDAHTHKQQGEEPWYYHRSFELMGIKSTRISDSIQIPETIGSEQFKKGNYHFFVTVEDLEGIITKLSEDIVIK